MNRKMFLVFTTAFFTLVGIGMNASALGASEWVRAKGGTVPANAIIGGRERDAKQRLYICRAWHEGGLHPGKIRKEFYGCIISWGGREKIKNDYEVLTEGQGTRQVRPQVTPRPSRPGDRPIPKPDTPRYLPNVD